MRHVKRLVSWSEASWFTGEPAPRDLGSRYECFFPMNSNAVHNRIFLLIVPCCSACFVPCRSSPEKLTLSWISVCDVTWTQRKKSGGTTHQTKGIGPAQWNAARTIWGNTPTGYWLHVPPSSLQSLQIQILYEESDTVPSSVVRGRDWILSQNYVLFTTTEAETLVPQALHKCCYVDQE